MPQYSAFLDAGFVAVCSLCGAQNSLALRDDSVRLRLSPNLPAADSTVYETVEVEVEDEFKIVDSLLIPRSGAFIATVTKAGNRWLEVKNWP